MFIGTNNGSQMFICLMGADEYSRLISRAVAALEINTFEDRRAIYNRVPRPLHKLVREAVLLTATVGRRCWQLEVLRHRWNRKGVLNGSASCLSSFNV